MTISWPGMTQRPGSVTRAAGGLCTMLVSVELGVRARRPERAREQRREQQRPAQDGGDHDRDIGLRTPFP